MDCKRAEELLIDFLYGDLDPRERAAFENHLQNCVQHAREVEQLQATLHLVRGQPLHEPDPRLDASILQAARAVTRESRPVALPWLAWLLRPAALSAAAAALMLTIGLLWLKTRPMDELASQAPAPVFQPIQAPLPEPVTADNRLQEQAAATGQPDAPDRYGEPPAAPAEAKAEAEEVSLALDLPVRHKARRARRARAEPVPRKSPSAGATERLKTPQPRRSASGVSSGPVYDLTGKSAARARGMKTIEPKPAQQSQPDLLVTGFEQDEKEEPAKDRPVATRREPESRPKAKKGLARVRLQESEKPAPRPEPAGAAGSPAAPTKSALDDEIARSDRAVPADEGDDLDAERPSEKKLREKSDTAEDLYRTARTLFAAGDCQAHIRAGLAAVRQAPRHADAADTLLDVASCQIRLSQYKQATETYLRIEREYPAKAAQARRERQRLQSTPR